MPTDTETAFSDAISTAAPTTLGQCVDSVIHITRDPQDPEKLIVHPEVVEVYYTHHGGRGDEMRPHRLLWMASFPRDAGEVLLIRVTGVKNPAFVRKSDEALQRTLSVPKSKLPAYTWVIRHNENAVETYPIELPTDWYGRINVKYDVELKDFGDEARFLELLRSGIDPIDKEQGNRRAHVDPDGNLIPDP